MSTLYPPTREKDWAAWASGFAQTLNLNPEKFNVTDAQAQEVQKASDAFVTALAVSDLPMTRTKPTIGAKDEALIALKKLVGPIVRQIGAGTQVTQKDRDALGLRPLGHRTARIPPPTLTPTVALTMTGYASLQVAVNDPAEPSRRAKPAGVQKVEILSFIGAEAPADMDRWTTRGTWGRTTVNLQFEKVHCGSKVWIRARYLNPRGENGPLSYAVNTILPSSNLVAEKGTNRTLKGNDESRPMKLAS